MFRAHLSKQTSNRRVNGYSTSSSVAIKHLCRTGAVLSGLITALLTGGITPVSAQVISPFSRLYNTKALGDIHLTGNTLLTCESESSSSFSGTGCSTAQSSLGSWARNDGFPMVYVDVDGDSSTFNSSTANLGLPTGATVLKAYLFWGGVSNSSSRTQVRFRTPASGYTTLNGILVAATNAGFGNSSSADSYHAYADVTSLVTAGSNGTYGIANVQALSGTASNGNVAPYAGWSLVVVYSAPNEKPRDLSVFSGLARVQQANPAVNLNISGFNTPPFGSVNARIGVVAYDGDASGIGDSLSIQRTSSPFNTTTLSNSLNPSNDFFNSTITRLGSHITAKNPNYINQMGGVDIDSIDNTTVLQNNDTSLQINLTTSSSGGETYFPGVVTTAIDLFKPNVVLNKSFTDVNGGNVEPGDILEYSITVTNNRNADGNGDPANNNVLTDDIPVNTTYVPNTLAINGVTKTDASVDDAAEFDAMNNRTVFRLGAGATGTQGGTLQVNTNNPPAAPIASATSTVTFRVRINPGIPDGTIITNEAKESFTGQTLGEGSVLDAATPAVTVQTDYPSIRGTLYEDQDQNSALGSSEPRLPAGIEVTLYQDTNGNNIVDGSEAVSTVNTDGNGDYVFLDVPYGTYKIQVNTSDPQVPVGFALGTPNNLSVTTIDLPVSNQNFGFIEPVSSLLLVKRITAITDVTNGNKTIFSQIIDDLSLPHGDDDNHPGWPNSYLKGALNGGGVKPGDEVEYTIYFLSSGNAPTESVRICDRLQPGQSFQLNTYGTGNDIQLGLGTGSGSNLFNLTAANDGGDRAQFIPAGGAVPSNCNLKSTNNNGTVMLDLTGTSGSPNLPNLPNSTGQGTPNQSYGFFRFVTKVEE